MVLGFVWYGPLFGKTWMRLIGAKPLSQAEMEKMQKKMIPVYALQFCLVLLQVLLLSSLVGPKVSMSVASAGLIWLGFVMPTIASICMWNNESRKNAWTRFALQAGYQLSSCIGFGIILALLYK